MSTIEKEFKEIDSKNDWGRVYQELRDECRNYKFTTHEAKRNENKNLNRYRDVSPYDHSRVKLKCGEYDYINASLVTVPEAKRAYILTQGPLPHTAGHFWQMVWEQNSKAVLMLNKVVEKSMVKCHQYWPLGSLHGGEDEMVFNNVGLKVKLMSENEASYFTINHLQITELTNGYSRMILHFHYTLWPDFGVPDSPASFLNLLMSVRESGVLEETVGPPVVHCSAGIGRSGTFCLVDSCLVMIENHGSLDKINIRNVLLEMRKCRMGLIQTHDQLRFSYLAVMEGAKTILSNNGSSSAASTSVNNKRKLNSSPVDVNGCQSQGETSRKKKQQKDYHHCPASEGSKSTNNKDNDDEDEEEEEEEEGEDDRVNAKLLKNSTGSSSTRNKDYKVIDMPEQKCVVENLEKLKKQLQEFGCKQPLPYFNKKRHRRSLFKQLSVGFVLLLGGGFLVYRYYWKK